MKQKRPRPAGTPTPYHIPLHPATRCERYERYAHNARYEHYLRLFSLRGLPTQKSMLQ